MQVSNKNTKSSDKKHNFLSQSNEKNFIKAKILSGALPFIQKFSKKIIVIKLGGSVLHNEGEKLSLLMQDIVLLKTIGFHPIIIHGGGKQISNLVERLGKKSKFIDGLRVTDSETMEIIQMVLAGLINKNIVSSIANKGGKAVGLSGKDGNIATAVPLSIKKNNYGQVGKIKSIDSSLITDLIYSGYIPVIAPVASNLKGVSFNINADTFATEIAVKMKAEKLIFISDVLGVMKNMNDVNSLISVIKLNDIKLLIKKKNCNCWYDS